MDIALIAGTRPEIIKMLPVYRELKQRAHGNTRLILTGQHRELAEDLLRMFDVRADHDMAVMQPGQTLVTLASNLATAFARYLHESPPEILLVQGDTSSAMLAGMFGFYAGIPVGHVEAGLRTGTLSAPYPEEFNRRVITLAARWHFAPTTTAAANLHREGITQEVHVVGNTAIDALHMMAHQETPRIQRLLAHFGFLDSPTKNTVLVTAHRRENFGDGIRGIATAMIALSAAWPHLHFVIPLHPNPEAGGVLQTMLEGYSNLHTTPPLGYDELLFLMQKSVMILTDSGGIQEEAPSFNVPVLVLRNETERPEGIAAGCSVLVGADPARIEQQFHHLMNDPAAYKKMAEVENPYGDGHAARRIADILLRQP